MAAAFVKPGNHTYIVSDKRSNDARDHIINIHECDVGSREDEIVPYERITKAKSGNTFNRLRSIFSGWPNENDFMFRQCMEHDMKLWKVTRLIKDREDYLDT